MKTLPLCLLVLLFATYSCKKGDSTDDDTNPSTNYQPTATFSLSQYGTADLYTLYINPTTVTAATIKDAAPNTSFTYEVTGSNGMKTAADTTLKGKGVINALGRGEIFVPLLVRYKDGTLTLNIKFTNSAGTTITATTKKEEFMIRNYKDLLTITPLNSGANSSDTYVQTQNIAFPDTILKAAPIYLMNANYDGQGYKITNLTIAMASHSAPMNDFLGFFAFIGENATVKNVRLEFSAAGISTPNSGYCGGIAAINWGTILNCSVKGHIKGGGMSEIGGLTSHTENGRLIGSSFFGLLEGNRTGGLTALLDSSYVNMCYSNYSVISTLSGGLTGWFFVYPDRLARDTVYNSYAYIRQATGSIKFYSLFYTHDPTYVPYVYEGCYSNEGIAQTKTIAYNTPQELNSMLLPLQVSNLPAGITAPPANKPFKNTGDLSQPPVLWWE